MSGTLSFMKSSFAATSTRRRPPEPAAEESVIVANVSGSVVKPTVWRSCPLRSIVTPSGIMILPSPRQSQFAVRRTVPERTIEEHVGIAPTAKFAAVSPVTVTTLAAAAFFAARYTPSERTSASYVAAVAASSSNTVPHEGRTVKLITFRPSARSLRDERSSATFGETMRPSAKSPVPPFSWILPV